AAQWARAHGRNLAILCSGDNGAFSLEDTVCAGLLVAGGATGSAARPSDGAGAAPGPGRYHAHPPSGIRVPARGAKRLNTLGHAADVEACLRRDVTRMVPVIERGTIVPGSGVVRPLSSPGPAYDGTHGARAVSRTGDPDR